jgi:uncharacterized damage-inducible protein DinB
MKNKETISVFQFNNRVLHMNLDDLSHEESLSAPHGGGNSINWVVGHMLVSRDDVFELLGMPRLCSAELTENYQRGSCNISPGNATNIKELIRLFDETQKALVDKISEMEFSEKENDLRNLTFFAFHEAYHCGQTGILRHAAGKEGAIK